MTPPLRIPTAVRSPGAWWGRAALAVALALAGCGEHEATTAGDRESAAATRAADEPVIGTPGGRLVVTGAEPGSYNPLATFNRPSRNLQRRLFADLVHINRFTQETEPALAESWTVSDDGRRYTLELRREVRWSDGEPFDADDVLFTFRAYLDPLIGAPNRDLLIVDGREPTVSKTGSHTVVVELGGPYAVGDRLFDSIGVLPEHRLAAAYDEERLLEAWPLSTPPAQIVGLGPFRPREYRPGERIVLERNPHYWKTDAAGQPLPYLDELVMLFVPSEDAQAIRFRAGDSDLLSNLGAENFASLEAVAAERGLRMVDLGPALQYEMLFFNLNDLSGRGLERIERKQRWFEQLAFRRAISETIDRRAIVDLAFAGRATPLGSHVTPGDRRWHNSAVQPPVHAPAAAMARLEAAGFRRDGDGALRDAEGEPVAFTLATNASNTRRLRALSVIQSDLAQLGIEVRVVALEFRAMIDRIFNSWDYDAIVLGLGGGDADPNRDLPVLLSDGSSHLWDLSGRPDPAAWQLEIDDLLRRQLSMLDPEERRRAYFRVQELVAENLPAIFLVSPNVLVGARASLGNFRPAVLDHHTLWNVEELFWTERRAAP